MWHIQLLLNFLHPFILCDLCNFQWLEAVFYFNHKQTVSWNLNSVRQDPMTGIYFYFNMQVFPWSNSPPLKKKKKKKYCSYIKIRRGFFGVLLIHLSLHFSFEKNSILGENMLQLDNIVNLCKITVSKSKYLYCINRRSCSIELIFSWEKKSEL